MMSACYPWGGVADLGGIIETYYRLFPDNRERTCYFFFDEVQNISGWEMWLRRLLDTEQVQIVVTGSSAKLLSREISTALRGRSLRTEMFPFNFRESLAHEGIGDIPLLRPGAKKRALVENRLRRYLLTGGFPEVQSVADHYRIAILQEYVDVVILRDIVERYQVSNILPLRALIRHLLASPATLFSEPESTRSRFILVQNEQSVSILARSMSLTLDWPMPFCISLNRTWTDCWKTLSLWNYDDKDCVSNITAQLMVSR